MMTFTTIISLLSGISAFIIIIDYLEKKLKR